MEEVSFGCTDFGVAASSEISIVTPGAGINLWFFGMLVTLKVLGNGTRGAYTLMETMVPPAFTSRKHLHLNEVETLFVLDGEVIVLVKDEEYHGKKGSFMHIPRLVPHNFINKSDKPAKLLMSFSPAGIDNFYLEVGKPVGPELSPPTYTEEEISVAIHKANDYGIVFSDRIVEPPLKFFD